MLQSCAPVLLEAGVHAHEVPLVCHRSCVPEPNPRVRMLPKVLKGEKNGCCRESKMLPFGGM